MAEFYFNQTRPERLGLRNTSNITRMSSNKNNEFKVPFPPRSATQTLSSTRPPQQNQEGSALQCLKPIAEKFEVCDKLGIVPQDVLQKMTSEFCQKLNEVCMDNLAQALRTTNSNAAPSVVNDNGSVLHSIISQAPGQPSVRSCICQGSTCGSEIGNPTKEPPLRSIPERSERSNSKPSKQSKPKTVPTTASNDETNDSIVSFFKKNQSQSQGSKVGRKKFAPALVTTNAVVKTATNSRANARTSRIDTVSRSQSATRPRSNAARSTQPRTQSVIPNLAEVTDDSELINSAFDSKVSVVISKVSEPKLTKNNPRTKRKSDTSVEPKKNKRAKDSSKENDDFNITKNSLRNFPLEPQKKSRKKPANEDTKVKRGPKKQTATKVNAPVKPLEANAEERNICGYDQTDQDMFGDVSTIINDTLQMRGSPNNILKNVTKVSTNKNDQPSHIFSPFSNIRSISGFSAISTPLSKTLPKTIINKRLKKPDVASEFKVTKSRPPAKRIVQEYVKSLDASQESDFVTSDFSDTEENSTES